MDIDSNSFLLTHKIRAAEVIQRDAGVRQADKAVQRAFAVGLVSAFACAVDIHPGLLYIFCYYAPFFKKYLYFARPICYYFRHEN